MVFSFSANEVASPFLAHWHFVSDRMWQEAVQIRPISAVCGLCLYCLISKGLPNA